MQQVKRLLRNSLRVLLVLSIAVLAGTWTNYTDTRLINAIAFEGDNTIWFGTSGGVVESDTNYHIRKIYTLAQGLVCNQVYSIVIDNHGNKWFGTRGSGVSKFDGVNWTTYTTAQGLANNYVYSMTADLQGNIWFGTHGAVSKFDGTNWTTYIFADDYVNSIAIDNEGNKWFGTLSGVSKFAMTPKSG